MEEEKARYRFIGPVCTGLLGYLACLLVAGLVGTVLLFVGLDWSGYLGPVSLSIVYAGIVLGGAVAAARAGARGWLVGLAVGIAAVAVSFVLCILMGRKDLLFFLALGRSVGACLMGVFGGTLGVNFALK
ncbi:MAG: TIGR04086 family membrane protein [Bacillota bacterium]